MNLTSKLDSLSEKLQKHFQFQFTPNLEHLVNKPLPAAGISADNVRG